MNKEIETISNREFIKQVSEETGFSQNDIKEVMASVRNNVIKNLENKKGTRIFNGLTVLPVFKPGRTAHNYLQDTDYVLPDRYIVKAKIGTVLKDVYK